MNECSLIAWIGNQDLWAMAAERDDDVRRLVQQATRGESRLKPGDSGPIRTLVQQVQFARIDLISTYGETVSNLFKNWLNGVPIIHEVILKDPTDYNMVFNFARRVFGTVWEAIRLSGTRLCVHLSPGTPTMAAVSVLLGKTMYPAKFFQTFNGGVIETQIPFDLTIDCLPDLLREPDRRLQDLAARSPGEIEGFEHIVGDSRAIRLAVGRAQRTAIRDISVLLVGASGTGKELFAKAIHNASQRAKHFFVACNCAAIPETLFEAEMFGVAKDTATGVKERPGAFAAANNGTLFLDEIGELSLENQSKLLRAMQPRHDDPACHRWIRRVGEETEKLFDVRVIAATNRNLMELVANHKFRSDLYYRIAVVTVELPPLRQRGSDIRLLAEAHLEKINREFQQGEPGYAAKKLGASALRRLQEHHWPGNVRELNNVLVQAAVMAGDSVLTKGDVAEAIIELPSLGASKSLLSRERNEGFKLNERLDDLEKIFIADALDDADRVQAEAARLLGLNSQQALKKKMDRLGISAGSGKKN